MEGTDDGRVMEVVGDDAEQFKADRAAATAQRALVLIALRVVKCDLGSDESNKGQPHLTYL